MNILFLSNLDGEIHRGPNNSVPAQIYAQSKIDNVLWFNVCEKSPLRWKEQGLPILTIKDVPSCRLRDFPTPFNKPDLIVFEQFYSFAKKIFLLKSIIKSKIPYIIIPRGELTNKAQNQKFLKKRIANLLFFYKFAKYATAIQYLTKQEQFDSGNKWNKKSFISSNGVSLPSLGSKIFNINKIRVVYIGRIDKYHKGLDLLIEACNKIQTSLRNFNFTIELYGTDRINDTPSLCNLIDKYNLKDIFSFEPAVFGEDKIKILQKADVFIMTSRFEGHPMGLIEALAYGLPCLVTTGTNMREEITNFNAGWTADTTVDSIAKALKKMISERSLFEQKSTNAKKLAIQYDWNKIAKKSHEIYKKIIRE